MAMFIPLFFRKAKPRSFNYRPIFYDRKKEILNERVRKGLQGDIFTPSIRKGSFKEYHSLRHRKIRRKSNFRILITVILLILLSLILLLL